MKKYLLLFVFSILFLVSCASKNAIIMDYNSEKLCFGIQNLTKYIESLPEIKEHFLNGNSDKLNLNYEIEELIVEGIPFPFFHFEIAEIIKVEEKISSAEAYNIVQLRHFTRSSKLNTFCLKKTNIKNPDFKIEYFYYPEYSLLMTEISKIKYKTEYGGGFLLLTKLDSEGKITLLKTSYWQE